MTATLKETAYQTIRDRLISGKYPPGSRISDDLIAREIGISRSPVREAINQFVSEGLVEYRPRCGTYVKVLSLEELDELWGVRLALESFAAMEAADVATSEDIEQLAELNKEIRQLGLRCRDLPGQVADEALKEEFMQLDSSFHMKILASAGNQLLLRNVQDCRMMTHVFGSHHSSIYITSSMLLESHRDHDLILKAIRNSDRDNAREWTAQHIRSARARVIAMAEQQTGQAD